MTTPWPNARVVANSQNTNEPFELTPYDIVQACRAQAASQFALACLQIALLPSALQNTSEAYGWGWDINRFGFALALGGHLLMAIAYFYYFKMGGYRHFEEVAQLFSGNKTKKRYWQLLMVPMIAAVVFLFVCILAGSFIDSLFHLPPEGRWLFVALSQGIIMLTLMCAAYIWWQRGEKIAHDGATERAKH